MLADFRIEPNRRMRAEGFKWDHEIQIALPRSYHESGGSYPVLWVTDGSYYFETAARVVNIFERQHIPEMIVVGVGVPHDSRHEYLLRRAYDFSLSAMSDFDGFGSELFRRAASAADEEMRAAGMMPIKEYGGASRFLTFLVEFVRTALQRDYRMKDDHTLFGHSGGGYFCTYVLFTRPQAFQKYVCGSPNLFAGNCELFRLEERYAQANGDLPANVFFGAGEGEVLEGGLISAWGIVSSTARMAEILRMRSYPSLRLFVRIFPGEQHESVIPKNLTWGLRTLWSNSYPHE